MADIMKEIRGTPIYEMLLKDLDEEQRKRVEEILERYADDLQKGVIDPLSRMFPTGKE